MAKKAFDMVGKRTIIAAVVRVLLGIARAQGWDLMLGEQDMIAILEPIVDASIVVFLALKGNRILKEQGAK